MIFGDEILAPIQTIDNVRHEENQRFSWRFWGLSRMDLMRRSDFDLPGFSCGRMTLDLRCFLLPTVCVSFQDVAWVCIPPSQHCQFSPNRSSQPSFLVFVSHQIHHHLLGTETLSHCCFFLLPQKSSETVEKKHPKNPQVRSDFFCFTNRGSEADVQAYRHLFRQIQSQNRDESGNLGSYWMKG